MICDPSRFKKCHGVFGWLAILWLSANSGMAAATARVVGQWPVIARGESARLTLQGNILYAKLGSVIGVFDVSDPKRIRRLSTFGGESEITLVGDYISERGFTPDGVATFRLLDGREDAVNPQVVYSKAGYLSDMPLGPARWPYVYVFQEAPLRLTPYDFSNPRQPVAGASVAAPQGWGVGVSGNVLAAKEQNGPVWFWDISDPANPKQRGSYPGPFNEVAVEIRGELAYLNEPNRFSILDISNLEAPRRVGSYGARMPWAFHVHEGMAVLLFGDSGTDVIDVSDPVAPKLLSHIDGLATGTVVNKGSTWFLSEVTKLTVVDLTDPSRPQILNQIALGGRATEIKTLGQHLYLRNFGDDLKILDVSQPDRPQEVGSLPEATALQVKDHHVFTIDLSGDLNVFDATNPAAPTLKSRLFVSETWPRMAATSEAVFVGDTNHLKVVDVTDDANPKLVASMTLEGQIYSLAVSGAYLYVTSVSFGSELAVFDISDWRNPRLVNAIGGVPGVSEIVISGKAMYLPAGGISMWDLTDPTKPVFKGNTAVPLGFTQVAWLDAGEDGRLYAVGFEQSPLTVNMFKMLVYDATSPFNLTLTNSLAGLPMDLKETVIKGNIAYIAAGAAGLVVATLLGERPAQPSLEIYHEGEIQRVRWLKDYSGYSLLGASSLNGPWVTLQLSVSPTGLFNEFLAPKRSGLEFFRLRKPN